MMNLIKSKHCLPFTLIISITSLILLEKYISNNNTNFIKICILCQVIALVAIFLNYKNTLLLVHIFAFISFIYGSLFIKEKIIKKIFIIFFLYILIIKKIRKNCMFFDHETKLELWDRSTINMDYFYYILLFINIYQAYI